MSENTDKVVSVATQLATAEFGPVGGLIVQVGAAMIARHRGKKDLSGMTQDEIGTAALELLAHAPGFAEGLKKGLRATVSEDTSSEASELTAPAASTEGEVGPEE